MMKRTLAVALVAFSGLAIAQVRPGDVECKQTETQSECHDRLKCKANEELEDCQKRLLKCRAGEKLDDCKARAAAAPANQGNAGQGNAGQGNAGQRDDANNRGGDRGADQTDRGRERDNGGGERRERDNNDRDRGDRGDRQGSRGERRRNGGGGKDFQANKTFGLGLELGEPTGVNGKYFVSPSHALDFGLGAMYAGYYYGDGFHIYGDYLFHPASLASTEAFELPFYIGPGVRYWNFSYCFQGLCNYGGSAIGIRVPIGISFDFNNVPLDIFIQVVPVLDFLTGDYYNRYGNREHFGVDLSLGVRYWFK
jgi:hypothetical protein